MCYMYKLRFTNCKLNIIIIVIVVDVIIIIFLVKVGGMLLDCDVCGIVTRDDGIIMLVVDEFSASTAVVCVARE